MVRSQILSTGFYVPDRVVSNSELEKIWETDDEWIQQRSGIKERRWIRPGEDTTASMGVKAAKQAIDKAGLKVDDIDAIIFGCLMSDYPFPGTGVLLQRELGMTRTIPALDIRNQCSGFIYGVNIADAWIRSGMYERILVVGSEIHSTSFDYGPEGRDVGVLFGDGAGAAIVAKTDNKNSVIIDSILHSEGKNAECLGILKPSTNDMPRLPKGGEFGREFYPTMNGKLVFKNAVQRMTEVVHEICDKNGLKPSDVDFVIAHQANMRINQMVMQQLELPLEKTHHTLDRYGNTTMATIPITFNEAVEEGKVKRGDKVIFVAFGAGFTWGATLFQF